jgi:hypothetical protein
MPQKYGSNINIFGVLGIEGITAVMTAAGATDADVFVA